MKKYTNKYYIMSKKIIYLLALFFILNSCSPGDDTQYSFKLMPIESVDIPAEFTLGETYPITVHYTVPTSCYYFSSLYYDKDLNIRTIAIENAIAQRNNCQDLSAAAAATALITEKSSESQSVDVTNKDMVNRYLRVFTTFNTSWSSTGLHLGHACPSRHVNV